MICDYQGRAIFIGGATLVERGGVLICIAIILAELAKTHAITSVGLYAEYMQVAYFALASGLIFGLTFGTVFMIGGGIWMGTNKLLGDT